ncbi:PF10758 domain protein [Leptospira weilii serovar Topaz str. LT2116]|uniref:PF10758 domain protein n=1 Tax=Leptospira weilii serovar Topaz str. LT2116 TaxID=1088540 RepID=M3FHK1_9LEPT|nr:PF10758 domain protein [Leptospira weilii serovar Topaz str. LT2116]
MAIGSVSTAHVSGGLGNSFPYEDKVHAKIGEAEGYDANTPILISSYQQGKDIFGKGELVDALKQHFEEFDEELGEVPVPVLCIRPSNDQAGSVDPMIPGPTNTGLADPPTISGTPVGNREVVLKITKAGALGTAEYRKSEDGGESFGPLLVTPVSGVVALSVGVTATFHNDTPLADTFHVGDTFTFNIKGPGPSEQSRLLAIQALKTVDQGNTPFYWFHHLGDVRRSFAISVSTLLEEMRTENLFRIFAVLEIERKFPSESVESYFLRIGDEWDSFENERVCVVGAEGRYIPGGINSNGGWNASLELAGAIGEWRNAATFLCARLAAHRVNVSAAWVAKNKSRTFIGIRYWNEGYKGYRTAFDDLGLTILQIYPDYQGVFIASDNLMAGATSDFQYIPELRRANKMHRIVYRESLPFLKSDTETNSGSGGLDYLKATVDAKVSSEMERAGEAEISGHEIKFQPIKTVNGRKILPATLKMFIKDRIDVIQWSTEFALA